MAEEICDGDKHGHGRPGQDAGAEEGASKGPHPVLPRMGSVLQAGAFGAVLGGVTTGVTEWARVKQGETSKEAAVENVVKSSAQSAATMAVATVAAHAVRSNPIFGVLALAAAGFGALLVLGNAQTKRPRRLAAARVHPVGSPQDPENANRPAAGDQAAAQSSSSQT